MKLVFNDPTFSFETLRTMGYASYGGSDIGEVLATANKIEEGNFESWFENWNKLATELDKRANSFETNGEIVSASQSYFKASNYYRTAEFFLHGSPNDERLLKTWSASRSTFQKALELSDQNYEIVDIPFENGSLPAYFYTVDDQARPTMLVHGGYDSTGEELYFQVVKDALARGYNCLTFEGPGQGGVLREQHQAFRQDWENVVSPVIDYLEKRPEVLNDKIILMGISFGGLLAARAAAFDHRIAACVTDDGLFSFQFSKAFSAHGGEQLNNFEVIENKLKELMRQSTQVRWVIENGLYTFGAKSIEELFQKTEQYTLEGFAEQIECPVLVCEASNDHFFKGQPELLYSHLQSKKTLMKFGPAEGAEEHCHLGALNFYNQKAFEWIEGLD
ncbi:alpha/beta hydrolase family protein [Pediococcus argentinicus]|uniref:AB hydrolase-1 domain-containing protein n=1 Tax=Pediococcus argentinicus TaxID=480391 RepID=A0A0R2N3H5_9LACO|nr:alpha/beta fold hydrolase [Pediococcus argentinicus]KRO20463.1 hypothetical protein IV88_GL001583 [Pediococcus argentinicus]NKZ23188.1 alpha/beta fold hydrolase [Pediococcus argentinicus]GEP20397.1 hypothetical dipeptidyl aminopeptidase/ acylaminoacyl-peptidase related protein [Pediococcus argentinicus]